MSTLWGVAFKSRVAPGALLWVNTPKGLPAFYDTEDEAETEAVRLNRSFGRVVYTPAPVGVATAWVPPPLQTGPPRV
jgi:hypothetical protein